MVKSIGTCRLLTVRGVFGALNNPRGLSVDEQGRVFLADTDNNRVLVFKTVTEFDSITLVPSFAIENLQQPHDVAYSDGGTPFVPDDDVLYVANTGRNEVRRYSLSAETAEFTGSLGSLGSAPGKFAGPLALTVGRDAGSHTTDVYVADAHNQRLVHLSDKGGSLSWVASTHHDLGVVTSLTSDHWGNLYAARPAAGVVKYTSGLKSEAGTLVSTNRPRNFHIPFVTVTDHRTGTRQRQGEGHGIIVEEWNSGSGLRLMKLGVEVNDLAPAADGSAAVDLYLTDQAEVTVELRDPKTGALVAHNRVGQQAAGAHRLALQAADDQAGWAAGEYLLSVTAGSTYEADAVTEVEMLVDLAGSGDPNLPASLQVLGNAPNPFNPSTTIRFVAPVGNLNNYSLNIYDTRGRLVRALDHGAIAPGPRQVVWDGRNDAGDPVGSGVYLYRVVAGNDKITNKMVLLK